MDKEDLLRFLGNNIRQIRIDKNITQQQLAADCNFEKSNMSRIEAGGSNLTIYTLFKIAEALDVKLVDLLKDNNS